MKSDTINKKSISEIIDEISTKYNSNRTDIELLSIRNANHKKYYDLDISFLYNVDAKYKKDAHNIITKYNLINSKSLLNDNMYQALNNSKYLDELKKDIIVLKERIKDDLNVVITYVDRLSDRIDVSKINRETSLGILILNKYNSFKLFSATLDLKDVNAEMKRQSKRLLYLKELEQLILIYNNTNCKYTKDNTTNFINNLYEIIGKYLFLLTDNEFQYTKEAIKNILSCKFDFIDKYIPTYKIIITRIWNSEFTGDYYFICNLDLDKDQIYLMNDNNIDKYDKTGYICDVPKNFIEYFKFNVFEIINYPLPCNLNSIYAVKNNCVDVKKINLKAMYTTKENINFKSILPVVTIKKYDDN